MLVPSRVAYGAVLFASLALVGAGYSASSHAKLPASLRPAPAATYIIGTTTGPLFYVQNNGTAAFNTYAVTGAAGAGPYAIGVLGYGANASTSNLALTGYDIGPGSIASVGDAVYPEPPGGPGSTATTGVLGLAPDGDGVMGQTSVQHGCCYVSDQASYSDFGGVVGADNSNNFGDDAGVIGTTQNGLYGVEGISSDGAIGGVEGIGTNGDGVDAFSTSADALYASSSGGIAVSAFSANADAIVATTNSTGSSDVGIYGTATGPVGIGMVGKATNSTNNSYGVVAYGAFNALGAVGLTSNAALLNLFNSSGTQELVVDSNGDLFLRGSVNTLAETTAGNIAREYVPKSTMQTIEDVGSGTLVNGTGVVHIDPSFAQMGDGAGYEVFLTPDGDSNGLYVAQKSASSFVVRESRGGRSNLAFDYRIVAKQYGHSAERASVAQTASAFVGHSIPPLALTPSMARSAQPHARAASGSATAHSVNTFAIPRAAAGLAHAFGH